MNTNYKKKAKNDDGFRLKFQENFKRTPCDVKLETVEDKNKTKAADRRTSAHSRQNCKGRESYVATRVFLLAEKHKVDSASYFTLRFSFAWCRLFSYNQQFRSFIHW